MNASCEHCNAVLKPGELLEHSMICPAGRCNNCERRGHISLNCRSADGRRGKRRADDDNNDRGYKRVFRGRDNAHHRDRDSSGHRHLYTGNDRRHSHEDRRRHGHHDRHHRTNTKDKKTVPVNAASSDGKTTASTASTNASESKRDRSRSPTRSECSTCYSDSDSE